MAGRAGYFVNKEKEYFMKKRFAFVMSIALLTGCAAGSADSETPVKNEEPVILEEEMSAGEVTPQ